jgi:hypothetical protein
MIASTIEELHEFAKKIGLHKCYYRNPRKKRHPHYDLMSERIRDKAVENGAVVVTDRTIVKLCREFYGARIR